MNGCMFRWYFADFQCSVRRFDIGVFFFLKKKNTELKGDVSESGPLCLVDVEHYSTNAFGYVNYCIKQLVVDLNRYKGVPLGAGIWILCCRARQSPESCSVNFRVGVEHSTSNPTSQLLHDFCVSLPCRRHLRGLRLCSGQQRLIDWLR